MASIDNDNVEAQTIEAQIIESEAIETEPIEVPGIPPGYAWASDLVGKIDIEEPEPGIYKDRKLTEGRTIVFEMTQPEDWLDIDDATRAARRKDFLIERYGRDNLWFHEENVLSKESSKVFIFHNDYYARFEVAGALNEDVVARNSHLCLEYLCRAPEKAKEPHLCANEFDAAVRKRGFYYEEYLVSCIDRYNRYHDAMVAWNLKKKKHQEYIARRQEENARRQKLAREQETARQQENARRQELARQQETARQQENARKQENVRLQQMARQQEIQRRREQYAYRAQEDLRQTLLSSEATHYGQGKKRCLDEEDGTTQPVMKRQKGEVSAQMASRRIEKRPQQAQLASSQTPGRSASSIADININALFKDICGLSPYVMSLRSRAPQDHGQPTRSHRTRKRKIPQKFQRIENASLSVSSNNSTAQQAILSGRQRLCSSYGGGKFLYIRYLASQHLKEAMPKLREVLNRSVALERRTGQPSIQNALDQITTRLQIPRIEAQQEVAILIRTVLSCSFTAMYNAVHQKAVAQLHDWRTAAEQDLIDIETALKWQLMKVEALLKIYRNALPVSMTGPGPSSQNPVLNRNISPAMPPIGATPSYQQLHLSPGLNYPSNAVATSFSGGTRLSIPSSVLRAQKSYRTVARSE